MTEIGAPALSVVVPVYGCRGTLADLAERVFELESSVGPVELILVDDASTDGSASVIDELCRRYPRVRPFVFARNRGQHYAQHFGIGQCRSDRVVLMDCDLENSPADIPRLIEGLAEADVVVSESRNRGTHQWHRRLARRVYGRLLAAASGQSIFRRGTVSFSFCALGGRAVALVKSVPPLSTPVSTLLVRSGLRLATRAVETTPDTGSKTSYGLVDNLDVALRSLIFTGKGLRKLLLRVMIANVALFGIASVAIIVQFLVRGSINGWNSLLLLSSVLIFLAMTNLLTLLYTSAHLSELGESREVDSGGS